MQTVSADRMRTMKMTLKKGKKAWKDVKLAQTKNMHLCMKIMICMYCKVMEEI